MRNNKTQHFNKLTEAEQERLAILIEECSEVQQIACKILRHGYESTNLSNMPSTNRYLLELELGDLAYAIQKLEDSEDVRFSAIDERRKNKSVRILPYLHHQ
jgi:hypothetical protein